MIIDSADQSDSLLFSLLISFVYGKRICTGVSTSTQLFFITSESEHRLETIEKGMYPGVQKLHCLTAVYSVTGSPYVCSIPFHLSVL